MKSIGVFFAVILVIILTTSTVSARPANTQLLSRQKRQSDQRLAELETLLALQKYGRHRFRMDRKKGAGADGEHPPGYGIIDFRMLGRKKKSTRFSPGELASSVEDRPNSYQQRPQLNILPRHQQQPRPLRISSSEEVEQTIYPDNNISISNRNSPSVQEDPFDYIEKK